MKRLRLFCVTVLASVLITGMVAGQQKPAANDLDEFMSKVMQKRQIDAEQLRDYIFSEKEVLEIKGPRIAAIESFRREYVWFVRDGHLVRSPVKINGVKVSAKEQAAAEEEWINKEKRRDRENSLNREAFFGFKFEPGRYLYAGERQFEGRKAVAIEYYPRMDEGKNGQNKKRDREDEFEHLFEKTFLVTMLIAPEEHQILQITFDNVGLSFIPARWLVRINDIKASMVMDKPVESVWLPRAISAYGSVSTAAMDLSIHYSREFFSYVKSDVKINLKYDMDKVEPTK